MRLALVLASLALVSCAPADFRSQDREGCKISDFWTVDPRLEKRLPENGFGPYMFVSIRGVDAAPNEPPDGICAYPLEYRPGASTYLLDDLDRLFSRDLGRPGPPDAFPDEVTLAREWRRLE